MPPVQPPAKKRITPTLVQARGGPAISLPYAQKGLLDDKRIKALLAKHDTKKAAPDIPASVFEKNDAAARAGQARITERLDAAQRVVDEEKPKSNGKPKKGPKCGGDGDKIHIKGYCRRKPVKK